MQGVQVTNNTTTMLDAALEYAHGTYTGYANHGCRCSECVKAGAVYRKNLRVTYGNKLREITRKQAKASREWLDELKSKPCLDCKQSFPPECMDFDHVRGEKIDNVGRIYKYNREKVLEEIEKCDLVCANCHRIRTSKRRA